MSTFLERLAIEAGLDTTEVEKGVKKIKEQLNSFEQGVQALNKKLEQAFSVGSMVIAARQFANFAVHAVEAAAQIGRTAEKVGMSVEQFSRLSYAAKLSGTSVEDLATGVKFFERHITDAQAGSKQQIKLFQTMGISTKDAGKALLDIADKFASYKDSAAKTALAVEIFGRGGIAMIPILNKGAEGIRQLGIEGDKLGVTLDDKAAKAAIHLDQELVRLRLHSEAVARSIGGPVLTALNDFYGLVAQKGGKSTDNFDLAFESLFKGSAVAKLFGGGSDPLAGRLMADKQLKDWLIQRKLAESKASGLLGPPTEAIGDLSHKIADLKGDAPKVPKGGKGPKDVTDNLIHRMQSEAQAMEKQLAKLFEKENLLNSEPALAALQQELGPGGKYNEIDIRNRGFKNKKAEAQFYVEAQARKDEIARMAQLAHMEDAQNQHLKERLQLLRDADERDQVIHDANREAMQHEEDFWKANHALIVDSEDALKTYSQSMKDLNRFTDQEAKKGNIILGDVRKRAFDKLEDTAIAKYKEQHPELTKAVEGSADILGNAVATSLVDGFDRGFKNIGETFKRFTASLAVEIAKTAILKQIFSGAILAGVTGNPAMGTIPEGLGFIEGGIPMGISASPEMHNRAQDFGGGGQNVQRMIHSFDHQTMDMTMRDAFENYLANHAATR
jgi:hypothetical protein